METIKLVNPLVWVFALILTGFVVIQATVFLRMALKFNKENNVLTDEELKLSMRTGIFSIAGPAFSVMITALSIIALMGSGATFMRIGVIGSASYELMLAGIAADTLGIELGSAQMTAALFTLALFAMILGSAPYFINCFLTLKPMEKSLIKAKTNKQSFSRVVGLIASITLMTYFGIDNVRKGSVEAIVLVTTAVVTYFIANYAEKSGKKWLFEWMLAIALIIGLAMAIFLTSVVGM